VVSTVDVEHNTTRTRVWLDGAPVTAGPHDGNPAWSPDGRWLAFTSRRGERDGDSTLHVLPVGGPGEVRTVCTMRDGLDDVAWSPDGRWLAFTSRTRDARYDAKDVSWQSPRKVERFFARLNGEDWVFDRPKHVHVVAADGTDATPRNLTPGEFQHAGVSWLADSSGVVTSAQRHDTWDTDLATDLYVVPLDGEPRALTARTGNYHSPSVSPSGRLVALIGSDDPLVYPQNASVGVVDVAGGEVRWISSHLDRTFQPTGGDQPPVWLDDDRVLALAEDRGETHLYEVFVDGRPPERRTGGAITVTDVHAAGGTTATMRSTVEHASDVWVERGDGARRLTNIAPLAPAMGAVHGAVHRRLRRDRRVGDAARRVRGGWELPRAPQRARRPVHPVRGGVLRRGADAGHGRLRGDHVEPPRRQRPPHRLGAVDHGADAPVAARQRVGHRRRRRRDGGARRRAHPLPVLRPRAGGHARRELRRLHGHDAGGALRPPLPRRLLRAVGQQPAHRGVVERHRHHVPDRARPRPGGGTRGVPADVAEHDGA
jgi:hypothetical protein